jgi:tripartite-type tricarboxylate transporter receptor subunit TctC
MRKKRDSFGLIIESVSWGLLISLCLPAYALSQAPFYQGKTITIIQGREPGGTGDLRVRALIPFLQKYIPGNPTIVSEYMPGGGGRKATNHIYRAARPDGLTIGNVGAGMVSNAILGEPGVQYDVDKSIYLGSINSRTSYIFLSNRRLGLNTLEKLRAYPGLRIGGQSVGHDIYINGRMFAWLLDLKEPKFVTGYSGPEIDAALMRGEVDARAQIADNVPHRSPEWIEKNLMDFHAILEFPKGFRFRHPVFDPVPALQDFAKTDLEKKVVLTFINFRLIGSPYIAPPNTPKERIEILKDAFGKALKDPQLWPTLKKLVGADPEPLLPDEQAKTVQETPRDPEVIKLFKRIAGGEALPPRR